MYYWRERKKIWRESVIIFSLVPDPPLNGDARGVKETDVSLPLVQTIWNVLGKT